MDRTLEHESATTEFEFHLERQRRMAGLLARTFMACLLAALVLPLYWGEALPVAVVFAYVAFTLGLALLLKGPWFGPWAVAAIGDVLMLGAATLYLGGESLVPILLAPTVVGYTFVSRRGSGLVALVAACTVFVAVLVALHLGFDPAADHVPEGPLWAIIVPAALIASALAGCYAQVSSGLLQVETDLLESWQREQVQVRRLQQELLSSSRLEGLGRHAAGIAHDFNNQLTAIIGFAAVLDRTLGAEHESHEDLMEITRAAHRSSQLTAQLLAFGRRELGLAQTTGINAVVTRAERLLRRILREDIRLVLDLDDESGLIHVDPAQLERVVVNLVANSRDALPGGGRIEIATRLEEVTEVSAGRQEHLRPGAYAVLTVSDDGVGMDEETIARVFEPYFTTKETGRGTGLGLATTYAIVKQSGGHISVSSRPGDGTRVEVYLPSSGAEIEVEEEEEDDTTAGGIPWPARILVVEDDDLVRRLAHRMLTSEGYRVTTAPGPREALRLVAESPKPPELVLTDVVMPTMSGHALVEQLLARFPKLGVVYMSGYTEHQLLEKTILEGDVEFVAKPFERTLLLGSVRRVLESMTPTAR